MQEEINGSWMILGEWLQRYFYSYIYEIFFSEFPIILYEWFAILARYKKKFQGEGPRGWNPQLIQRLESVNNTISKVVGFYNDNIIEWYITDIIGDTIKSYSENERDFFQAPRGIYLKYSKLWIKILVCEKGFL